PARVGPAIPLPPAPGALELCAIPALPARAAGARGAARLAPAIPWPGPVVRDAAGAPGQRGAPSAIAATPASRASGQPRGGPPGPERLAGQQAPASGPRGPAPAAGIPPTLNRTTRSKEKQDGRDQPYRTVSQAPSVGLQGHRRRDRVLQAARQSLCGTAALASADPEFARFRSAPHRQAVRA